MYDELKKKNNNNKTKQKMNSYNYCNNKKNNNNIIIDEQKMNFVFIKNNLKFTNVSPTDYCVIDCCGILYLRIAARVDNTIVLNYTRYLQNFMVSFAEAPRWTQNTIYLIFKYGSTRARRTVWLNAAFDNTRLRFWCGIITKIQLCCIWFLTHEYYCNTYIRIINVKIIMRVQRVNGSRVLSLLSVYIGRVLSEKLKIHRKSSNDRLNEIKQKKKGNLMLTG